MIIRKRENTLKLLFAWHGTILPRVMKPLIFFILFSSLISYISARGYLTIAELSGIGFTIFGVILSLFLSFRNTASYERWWEGRKLWGSLIATSRHISRDSQILDAHCREKLMYRVMLFVHLLRDRLRQHPQSILHYKNKIDIKATDFNQLSTHLNGSQWVLEKIQADLVVLFKRRELSDIIYQGLTTHIRQLGEIQAGCDRILSTPLPFSYSVLLHRAVYSFCLLLPFILEKNLGFWTPLLVGLISYLFLGLDALSQELEEPFGLAQNALSLDAMVCLIEREMSCSLGHEVKAALVAHNDYLS